MTHRKIPIPTNDGQFTYLAFTNTFKEADIKITMDGRSRRMDTVFIERLWRSLKYECVYLHAFEIDSVLCKGIRKWMQHYNFIRPHSTFEDLTLHEVYNGITNDNLTVK